MLSNILNIYCKNIFNNFLIAESCRTRTHIFQKLPSPAPAPAPESRNAPVLHRWRLRLSLNQALKLAADIGLDNVIVEGDSLVVTQALKSKVVGLAACGLLIRDAFSLAGNFSKVSYSHIKREGNKVAHGLAKLAVNLAECVIWMEEVPPSIYHLV